MLLELFVSGDDSVLTLFPPTVGHRSIEDDGNAFSGLLIFAISAYEICVLPVVVVDGVAGAAVA